MRLSERWGRAAALLVSGAWAAALGGCGVRSLTPDGGTGAGGRGECPVVTQSGGVIECPSPRLSDFEDLALATITRDGSPPRNGSWHAYNDGSIGCNQIPRVEDLYIGEAPPTLREGTIGSLALHAFWKACTTWGAGVGADINDPLSNDWGRPYAGPRVPYDLSGYTGVTFWAMAMPGTDVSLRFKMVMRASSRIQDGGLCDETVLGLNKCGDEWGQIFALPSNGTWKQFTIKFASGSFQQEGWGAPFKWDASDVVGIQIQSVEAGPEYDFWIDDMYLIVN